MARDAPTSKPGGSDASARHTRLPPVAAFAGRPVGSGHPCYVIAEAGSNHNGSLDLAFGLIDAAADARCDAVKFQVFRPQELLAPTSPRAGYLDGLLGEAQTLYELFAQTAMDREWLPRLAARCKAKDVHFIATPFDADAVTRLAAVGSPALKNASSELWDLDLIEAEAATGLPLIISTGMADLDDVDDALAAAAGASASAVCLLHCTVRYPTPPQEVNLEALNTLRSRYNVPVGLSDHTTGWWATVAAVARGANLIEKHFTLDRTLPGPDQPFGLEPSELISMVEAIRATEAAIGDGDKRRQPGEEEIYQLGRRNLVAARNLAAGTVLTPADLDVLRSPLGIAPKHRRDVVGRRLRTSVTAGTALQWSSLD